jgi:hypothetical protein
MGAKGKGKARAVGAVGAAFAAGIFVVPERERAGKDRDPWKVGCVHRLADPEEGCAEKFDPNGIGSAAHTTCPEGRATLAAMRAARDAGLDPRPTVLERMNAVRAEHKVKLAVTK